MFVVIFCFVFFFFQAEDGIRDGTVTGVQTCALPISSVRAPRRAVVALLAVNSIGDQPMPSPRSRRPSDSTSSVAACFARCVGETNGRLSRATPSRAREVRAARYVSE